MPVSRWFYWLPFLALVSLCSILGIGGRALYKSEIKKIQDDINDIVRRTAEEVQNENLTLNNLTQALTDKDYNSKVAFAIGMTQNQAKMNISFDDSINNDHHLDTVVHIDRKFLAEKNVKFVAGAVKNILYYDSLLKTALKKDKLSVTYKIEQAPSQHFPTVPQSSGLFIINYYDPEVYRVVYTIPVLLVVSRSLPYLGLCLTLLILCSAAIYMYQSAFCLRIQTAQFKESMFSNVTHELKTPLSSLQIIVNAFKLDSKGLSARQQEYIEFAEKEMIRMNVLVERILSFGKLDQQQFALNKEVVNLNSIINEAIATMQVKATQMDANIQFNPYADHDIRGDKVLLLNTFVGLIDNAIKYNTGKPIIHISIRQDKDFTRIAIKDNGIGIGPRFHLKIFEPFFRVPTGDIHKITGHGLGLSFAKQVIKLHLGQVYVESDGTTGSIFIILLPLF